MKAKTALIAAVTGLATLSLTSCLGFDAVLDPGDTYWSVDDYIGAPGYWGPGIYGNGWGTLPPPPPAFGPSYNPGYFPGYNPGPQLPPPNRPSRPQGPGNINPPANPPSATTPPSFPTTPSGTTRPGNNGRPR